MINTYIAFDDEDYDLGDYFEESHVDIVNEISRLTYISNISIGGLNCTEDHMRVTFLPLQGTNFIFIALCHGDHNQLLANEVFISETNANLFACSLVYSTACLTGKNLGNILIDNGCHAFIGYSEEVLVIPDYYSTFYSCENFAIKSFLQNDETIEVSFDKMVNFYTDSIDKLLVGSFDDVLAATTLADNRDCLVLLGNKTLTKEKFN